MSSRIDVDVSFSLSVACFHIPGFQAAGLAVHEDPMSGGHRKLLGISTEGNTPKMKLLVGVGILGGSGWIGVNTWPMPGADEEKAPGWTRKRVEH